LRKRCLTDLADEGKTVYQVAAVSGHLTLKEVDRYTKRADRVRNGRAAMHGRTEEEQADARNCHTAELV
jgi:hypothetical protein